MNRILNRILTIALLFTSLQAFAQDVDVDINVNVKHTVGGVSTFDRSKFITVAQMITSGDWDAALLADFMTGYDVYFGRDTGGISSPIQNSVTEDSSKSGWASESSIASLGASSRNNYNNQTWRHPYEFRSMNDVMGGQFHAFWPDGSLRNGPGGSKWAFSTTDTTAEPFGSAVGHYMGHYMTEFYGSDTQVGRPFSRYLEVVNEPDWALWGAGPPDSATELANAQKLWTLHNSVAIEAKNVNSNLLVGGHCSAFPDFENNNFDEWNKEWKAFIDNCGANMDYYVLHFYDFNESSPWIRRGSNIEASLDMVEHYSDIVVGKPLPFAITEYGGRDRSVEGQTWSAARDWKSVKSYSSMMMSFMDRPHLIYKAVPFVPVKATWGYGSVPYPWRLQRRANEPASYSGDWVYTDHVRFYQLWSDVKGTRVDIIASDPDVQVDAYVDGDKAYVILNNLNSVAHTISLNLFEANGNTVQRVLEKSMYWGGSAVAVDETLHTGNLPSVTLPLDGTVILEYTFSAPVAVDETSDEVKYYATTHLQPISAGETNVFIINGVSLGAYGDAALRLGMGRAHSRSKQPVVFFNGAELTVTPDFMGHEGDSRSSFFGQLDIPVPYDLLQVHNSISVTFPDSGGHISSVSLRAYEFSTDVRGTGPVTPPEGAIITSAVVEGYDLVLSISNGVPSGYFDLMSSDDLTAAASNWVPSRLGLQFDAMGEAVVTNPVSESREFFSIWEPGTPIYPVTGVSVTPAAHMLSVAQTIQLAATVTPGYATDPSVIWSSGTPAVATVDTNGLVTALQTGSAVITATTSDGGFTDTCDVTVTSAIQATFDWAEADGVWWYAYGYTETENDITLVAGGRSAAHDAGDGAGGAGHAFKASYEQDAADGTFAMEYDGGAVEFTVTSIDISGDAGNSGVPQGDLVVKGVLGGVEQWSINPVEDGDFHTYTSATSGNMSLLIDTIIWSAPYDPANAVLVWGNKIDNLAVVISP